MNKDNAIVPVMSRSKDSMRGDRFECIQTGASRMYADSSIFAIVMRTSATFTFPVRGAQLLHSSKNLSAYKVGARRPRDRAY